MNAPSKRYNVFEKRNIASEPINNMTSQFRSLPSVEHVLSDDRICKIVSEFSRQPVVSLIRANLEKARLDIKRGLQPPDLDGIVANLQKEAQSKWRVWPADVINGTRVILHTNLGRSPLSAQATEAVTSVSRSYSDLEFDLQSGKRGSRQSHMANLINEVTGSEASIVVNNNASAVMLGLAAIAGGKEVIVSRSEAVEIGGGFRIPDVLLQSGAILKEVGTTNRTYVGDYEAAITENTGAILVIHPSNFRISGFTHSPLIKELVDLGRKTHIPILHDLGSGCLLDTSLYGMAHEPMPQESINDGVDVTFFSGDKLLGGPQSGIICGRAKLVTKISQHPLARAVRIDKMSIAALSATILHYIKQEATEKIPIWQMISMKPSDIFTRAEAWASALNFETDIRKTYCTIGGGSLPGEVISSWGLFIPCSENGDSASKFAGHLRKAGRPVVGRIEDENVIIEPRTVLVEDDQELIESLNYARDKNHTNEQAKQA